MKNLVFSLIILAAFAVLPKAHAFDGPLQVRNQFPMFLGMNQPFFESALPVDSVSLSLHHSSVYVVETSNSWSVNMDLELTELDLRLKKKIGTSTEFGLDIPVIRPTGGFFDPPLEDWHAILGMGDYGRHERPNNAFLYTVSYNGISVIQGVNDRTALGDVRLSVKQVIRFTPSVVSILANLELPTGDAKTGYGNGSFDAGLAVLLDFSFNEIYRGHLNAGAVFLGDLKAYQTIPLGNFWYCGFGIEAGWWERFKFIIQTMVQSSPLPDTGIRQVDWPGVLLTAGGRYAFKKSSIEFSLTEDPDTAGTPDFIANAAYTMKF